MGDVGPGTGPTSLPTHSSGERALEASAADVDRLAEVVGDYLVRYRDVRSRSDSQEEESFDVLVETTLSVDARDQASARQEAEDAFAKPRRLAVGVWSKGPAWAYEAVVDESK